MPQKFSPSTGCFYPAAIAYASIPDDAIEVEDALFREAMARDPQDTLAVVDGALTVVPYAGPTLAQAQTAQIAMLNNAFQAAISAPVSFVTAAGATHDFAQSARLRGHLSECIAAAGNAWTADLWLDASNQPVSPFSFADLQGLAAAMDAVDAPAYHDLLTKIAAVTAATTVAAVAAIVF